MPRKPTTQRWTEENYRHFSRFLKWGGASRQALFDMLYPRISEYQIEAAIKAARSGAVERLVRSVAGDAGLKRLVDDAMRLGLRSIDTMAFGDTLHDLRFDGIKFLDCRIVSASQLTFVGCEFRDTSFYECNELRFDDCLSPSEFLLYGSDAVLTKHTGHLNLAEGDKELYISKSNITLHEGGTSLAYELYIKESSVLSLESAQFNNGGYERVKFVLNKNPDSYESVFKKCEFANGEYGAKPVFANSEFHACVFKAIDLSQCQSNVYVDCRGTGIAPEGWAFVGGKLVQVS